MKLTWTAEERQRLLQEAQRYIDSGRRIEWAHMHRLFQERNLKQIKEQLQNLLRAHRKSGTQNQCRFNHKWSLLEEENLITLVKEYGTNWGIIVTHFSDKTINQLKNKYYSVMARRNSKNISYDDMILRVQELLNAM